MTPQQFRQWRYKERLSQQAAAQALGCSRRRIIELEADDRRITRETDLACAALALSLRGWSEYGR